MEYVATLYNAASAPRGATCKTIPTVTGKPFDQRFVYGVVALAVASLVSFWIIAEAGHARMREATFVLASAQQRFRNLAQFQRVLFDAEASQRGFLLTESPKYLKSFDPAVAQIEPLLDEIQNAYLDRAWTEQLQATRRLRSLSGIKVGEMLGSLRLYAEQNVQAATAFIDTDLGKKTMDDIRKLIGQLQDGERERIRAASDQWLSDLSRSRTLVAAGALLNIVLVIVAGMLVSRDFRRRDDRAKELASTNAELDRAVHERTATLSDLSSHLQTVTEAEKESLARELHDELGGLLVATKMDVVWLRRRLGAEKPELTERWERVLRSLESGVEFKRRVIENLHPTLLDNLGLIPALRWLSEEACQRASLKLDARLPEELPELSAAANIAVFRAVQECLTNIARHARASKVQLVVESDVEFLTVTVKDDGVGIDPARTHVPQSHGLSGMRHRIHGLCGELTVRPAQEKSGTEVVVRLPWSNIRRIPGADSTLGESHVGSV